MSRLYSVRDIIALGQPYAKHVAALTAEGLYSKAAIAAELAYRDSEIQKRDSVAKIHMTRIAEGDVRLLDLKKALQVISALPSCAGALTCDIARQALNYDSDTYGY